MNIKRLLLNTSFLGVIKIVTMAIGLVQNMLLAHFLSVDNYALYSQSFVLINTVSGITAFGFADSVIFFSGISNGDNDKKSYVSTIFLLEIIFCLVSGVVVFLLRTPLSELMNNSQLTAFILLIAFFPLFINLSNCLNQLLFTEKKVKSIGIGNFLFSGLSLTVVFVAIYNPHPIWIYLTLELFVYFLHAVFLCFCYLKEKKRFISFSGVTKTRIRIVLSYALPLGVAIFGATLLKEADKIIISSQCSTVEYATYAAVSRQLPVTFFSAALAAQLVPFISKSVNSKNKRSTSEYLKIYYLFGFVSSLILGLGVFSVSKQALVFLYSDKYIDGLGVFIVYIIVDIISFAYPGMLLTVSGKSKELLIHSLIMLVANVVLNIIFLKLFGIIGPAIATLLVQIGGLLVQTGRGLRTNALSFKECVPLKDIFTCILICIPVAILFFKLSNYYSIHYVADIFVYGGGCVVLNGLFCFLFLKNKAKSNKNAEGSII